MFKEDAEYSIWTGSAVCTEKHKDSGEILDTWRHSYMLLVSSINDTNTILQKLHFDVIDGEILPYVKVIGKEFEIDRKGFTYQFNIKSNAEDILSRWLYGLSYALAVKQLRLRSKSDYRHAETTPNCHTGAKELTRIMNLPFDASMLETKAGLSTQYKLQWKPHAGQTLPFAELRQKIISRSSDLVEPPELITPY